VGGLGVAVVEFPPEDAFVSLVERILPPVTTEIRDSKIISIFYVAKNEIT